MRSTGTFLLAALIVAALIPAQGVTLELTGRDPAAAEVPAGQSGIGSAFTYQGRLDRGGLPFSGTCDMTFSLYDQPADGGLVAGPLAASVGLAGGLFAIDLDFGLGAFSTGEARWLEVAVQCPGDAVFTTLPRQALTATPYALYAQAGPWSGLTGVPAGIADGIDNDTQYTAAPGGGLLLTGTTLSVDSSAFQKRVFGLCDAGSAIHEIGEDGSVVCDTTGDGDITAVYTGTGLLGGGLSGGVTVWADTDYVQQRVVDPCPDGKSIRAISADGIPSCETDDDTTYYNGNHIALDDHTFSVLEGHNQGLDADTLDGPTQHGSFYLNAGNINAGSLDVARFVAFVDLGNEGYLSDLAGDLAQNDETLQPTLNADLLDSHTGAFYQNASNFNAGTLGYARFSAYDNLADQNLLGTANGLALNNGALQPNLNAAMLNSLADSAYQRRVTGTCGTGSAFNEILDTGGVNCESVGGGTITAVNAGTGLTGGGSSGEVTLDLNSAYRLPQNCTNSQLAKWTNAGTKWECRDDQGTTGTLTGVTAGTGLTVGGTATDVTVGANTAVVQARVTQACGAGSSLQAIAANGTGTCVADANTTYTAHNGLSFSGTALTADTAYLQSRVSATTCYDASPKQAIRAINASGDVTCESIPQGTITGITATANTGLTASETNGNVTLAVTFAMDSSTYEIACNEDNKTPPTSNLRSDVNSFCALTQVEASDLDNDSQSSYCTLARAGGYWTLQVVCGNEEDIEYHCQARCLTW